MTTGDIVPYAIHWAEYQKSYLARYVVAHPDGDCSAFCRDGDADAEGEVLGRHLLCPAEKRWERWLHPAEKRWERGLHPAEKRWERWLLEHDSNTIIKTLKYDKNEDYSEAKGWQQ